MNSTQQLNDTEELTGSELICNIMVAEGVIGVFGNLLVCFVILRVKFLHNMTNYLLVNLAVADMLLCLQSAFVPTGIIGRELFCRVLISEYLAWALSYASAYNLCAVTIERYVAIMHPLQYKRKLTATRMKYLIALIWVISFLFSSPFIFTIETSNNPEHPCFESKYPHHEFPILLNVFSFFMGYLLPIALMSWAYYKIQITLKRQAKVLNLQYARAAAYDLVLARHRLVRTLLIVLGSLIILLTPSSTAILLCLHPIHKALISFCDSHTYGYILAVCDFFYYFNSVINPIIYELKYKKFRQGVKVAFCSCFKRHGNNRVDIEMIPL
ncbi:trace amine-associated receptor 6-like [Patiria miniata]|uniref:G-protein coupled receptors family 1 profile domain-containing protein n=1 Tax=Patiria miniata TaxID=46514 RepID=A0A913ZNY5_PATMI|nr:trace amine-associated receptor 6-like [Patiria miniata]